MRLKTFTAPTTARAMEMVRRELGEDAIIVATQKASDGRSARVTAALEDIRAEPVATDRAAQSEPIDVAGVVRQALVGHGTPASLASRLAETASGLGAGDPTLAFAGAMDADFTFGPLSDQKLAKPVMLVGPPGAGKTITTAKLAARTALSRRPVSVITADTQRAGAVEQLQAFTRILSLELETADGPESLARLVAKRQASASVYVDTGGVNPFSDEEMERLDRLVHAAAGEPVLVLAAGGDALESAEIARAFAAIGARRLIVTRLDMTRRLGSVLAAADAARLMFANVSITPHVANGLSPINPVSLARLIMPEAGAPATTERQEPERQP